MGPRPSHYRLLCIHLALGIKKWGVILRSWRVLGIHVMHEVIPISSQERNGIITSEIHYLWPMCFGAVSIFNWALIIDRPPSNLFQAFWNKDDKGGGGGGGGSGGRTWKWRWTWNPYITARDMLLMNHVVILFVLDGIILVRFPEGSTRSAQLPQQLASDH